MAVEKFNLKNNKLWLDYTNPTKEELLEIVQLYNVELYLVEDSVEVGHLPKYENTEKGQFLITRFIHDFKLDELKTIKEFTSKISFYFTSDLLITIHRLDVDFIFNKEQISSSNPLNINDLVENLLLKILNTYSLPATSLSEKIDQMEDKIFLQETNNTMSKYLYIIKRETSSMKKLLVLSNNSVLGMEKTGFNSTNFGGLKDIQTKLMSITEQNLDDVTNLISLYYAISAQKTNDIMKTLTILTMFFMPLTFIAGIYGMNFEFMPELKLKYGYPFVILFMIIISYILYINFKKKRWI